jgi:hemerythrin superfamily protein
MGILDKVIGAVTPPESDEKRMEARARARSAAVEGSWLAMALDHHDAIENGLAQIKSASDAQSRRTAQLQLAALVTGHSVAEEAVLYPALALNDEKGHATKAYTEQSAAKIQMAALEDLDPMSKDYLDKLEHIRGALTHHMYEEESEWFPELLEKVDPAMQQKLNMRFSEEFGRYDGGSSAMSMSQSGMRSGSTGTGNMRVSTA